jgi:hypothetical protein
MEVDPAFNKAKRNAKKRKTGRRIRQFVIFGGGFAGVALVTGIVLFFTLGGRDDGIYIDADDGPGFVQVEENSIPATSLIRTTTPFVDIAGDPMILRFERASGSEVGEPLAGPPTLDAERLGNPAPDRLLLVVEALVVQERQLITALPSSREDFAFFQAHRSQSQNAPDLNTAVAAVPAQIGDDAALSVVLADDEDSWGAAIGDEDVQATYVETRIENTTSITFVKPEATRRKVYEDLVVRLVTDRKLEALLTDNGFAEDQAKRMAEQIITVIPEGETLTAGSIIALRNRPEESGPVPLQVSIYGPDGYVGSAARRGTVGYVASADPWIDVDLFALSAPVTSTAAPAQDFRLLDAVYSAAIRRGVPTTLVGEMIVMLSQAQDLDAFAAPGDELTLLYAPNTTTTGPGQILFAGIKGPSGDMPCYVGADAEDTYSCFSQQMQGGGAGGFHTPVQGTMTSAFGPRFHPILRAPRLHGGVDWAAPTGTPIIAALSGQITRANVSPSYGNIIYIDHPGGLQSRYAHMDRFAAGMRNGVQVNAGQLIGYVGTTGRSTGPHLHFEMRVQGEPVDPLTLNYAAFASPQAGGGARSASVVQTSGSASAAVEGLVNQIIRVESGGNASAKNPLSSATGLGQFIESTWLRMMRDYRPDLAQTMNRAAQLDLRNDPTLSREMVTNLARENERYLQSKGHAISAGRLYLAHFLGPGGANRVLSSGDGNTILAVMGSGVVGANPFLTNYTVADLKAWADRKMHGSGSASRPEAAVPRLTAEMRAYIEIIDELISVEG